MTESADRRSAAALRLIFGGMLAVQLLMHLNCDTLFADDGLFYTALDGGGKLLPFLADRWARWSGRLIIEGILALSTHSIRTWRVLDSFVMTGLAWGIFRLSDGERRADTALLSCLMVLSIPFSVIRSTGWQATSVNYTWPLSAALVCLVPSVDRVRGRRPSAPRRVLSLAAAVLAANQEQMAVLLFLLSGGVLIAAKRRERKTDGWTAAILAIAAAELALHLLCPGSRARSLQSVNLVNLRDYGRFTLIDKLSIGLTSTGTLLFYMKNRPFWIFLALILGAAAGNRRSLPALAVCCAAPAFCLAAGSWRRLSGIAWLGRFSAYDLQLGPARILDGGQTAGMFVFTFVLLMTLLSLYAAGGETAGTWTALFVLAAGFAARMVLSFSPTVVESGERTMLPLYAAMMLSALCCAAPLRGRARLAPAWLMAFAAAAMNAAGSFALAA